MITITIKRQNSFPKQVILKGHAGFDEYGKDIVCAGVSSILTTTVNALLKLEEKSITYQENDPFILNVETKNHVTEVLVENMIDLLKELSVTYPKNIKIKEEIE